MYNRGMEIKLIIQVPNGAQSAEAIAEAIEEQAAFLVDGYRQADQEAASILQQVASALKGESSGAEAVESR